MRMCDKQTIKGWWFLPSSSEVRIPGVLTWSQEEGVELELIGGFHIEPERERAGENLWKVELTEPVSSRGTIYGETAAGKPITLWEAELRNYKTNLTRGPLEQFWHSPWLCVGAHLPSAESEVLRHVTAGIDLLYDLTSDGRFCVPHWAKVEGVENPGQEQQDGTLLMPYALPVIGGIRAGWATGSTDDTMYFVDTIATRPPVLPITEAMPHLKLESMTKRTRSGRTVNISVSARARIIPKSNVAPTEILTRLSPLLELVRLATYTASAVTSMSAITNDDREVSLLCRLGHESDPDALIRNERAIFTLDDVSLDHFLQVRQRLTATTQARYAWNAVVGLIGHSPRLVEEHVSQVLAAAEGFHRWCLRRAHKKILKDRLIELHARLAEDVKAQLGIDVEKWSDWAVWIRNHVAHGGAEKHRNIGDFYHMKVVSDSVCLVTYLALLAELGVPEEKVNETLLNHPEVSVIRKRCAEIETIPDV